MPNGQMDPVLIERGKALLAKEGNIAWEWADLVLEVAPPGTTTLDELRAWADEIGWFSTGRDLSTLTSFRTTALAWPPEQRCAGASYTAHAELAGCPQRFEIIRPGLTKREARAAAGNKPLADDHRRKGDAVANLLSEPETLEQIATDPKLAQALALAAAKVADEEDKHLDRSRRERHEGFEKDVDAIQALTTASRLRYGIARLVRDIADGDMDVPDHAVETLRAEFARIADAASWGTTVLTGGSITDEDLAALLAGEGE